MSCTVVLMEVLFCIFRKSSTYASVVSCLFGVPNAVMVLLWRPLCVCSKWLIHPVFHSMLSCDIFLSKQMKVLSEKSTVITTSV